jgi:WD40 repeat protein
VLVTGFDGIISVYKLNTPPSPPTPLGIFGDHLANNGPRVEAWTVAVTPDGTTAVSSTNSGEILIWEVNSLQTKNNGQAQDTDDPVASLVFLPNQSATPPIRFLAGFGDGRMVQYRYDASGLTLEMTYFQGNHMTVNSIALCVSGSDTYAITGGMDAAIRVWKLKTTLPSPPIVTTPDAIWPLHSHFIWRVAAFSNGTYPSGSIFASVSEDHSLQIFDGTGTLKNFKKVKTYPHGIMGVDFLNNAYVVITTDQTRSNDPADSNIEVDIIPFT